MPGKNDPKYRIAASRHWLVVRGRKGMMGALSVAMSLQKT
jgi:hypothetical protein